MDNPLILFFGLIGTVILPASGFFAIPKVPRSFPSSVGDDVQRAVKWRCTLHHWLAESTILVVIISWLFSGLLVVFGIIECMSKIVSACLVVGLVALLILEAVVLVLCRRSIRIAEDVNLID